MGDSGEIWQTTRAGGDWGGQTSGTANTLNGVACASPSACVAVGDGPTIVWTTDGGSTWRSQTSGLPSDLLGLYGVACLSPSTCLAVGTTGTILRSTGGGSTWSRIHVACTESGCAPPTGTSNNLTGVACRAPSTCVAVGDKGTILRSTDGGHTWRSYQ